MSKPGDLDSIRREAKELVARRRDLLEGRPTRNVIVAIPAPGGPVSVPIVPGPPRVLPAPTSFRTSSGIEIEERLVSPAEAESWLREKNPLNRKIRGSTVRAYMRDMVAGDWLLTHQGVAFGPDGNLVDGQHRLQAIVWADRAALVLIFRLPDPQSRTLRLLDVIDRGAARSTADSLRLAHGVQNANLEAATAVAIARTIVEKRGGRITTAQVLGVRSIFEKQIREVVKRFEVGRSFRFASVTGPIAYAAAHDINAALEFADRLLEGSNLRPDSPILHLRNFLFSKGPKGWNRSAGSSQERGRETVLQCLFLCFKGRPMPTQLTWSKAGAEFFAEKLAKQRAAVEALFLK